MMLATKQPTTELALPALDLRTLARRLAPAALLAAAAIGLLLLAGGHARAFTDALARGLGLSPGWAVLAVTPESLSVAGYVVLLSLVAGRAAPRIALRESAQITLAGTAATRLLPTAGAGGAALTVWTLRRAGLETRTATRTLLAFLVVLYSVFLASILIAGAALLLGLAGGHGPAALSAIPALAALTGIVVALALALRRSPEPRTRVGRGAQLLGAAVRDALALVRSRDPRLAGALAYWLLDAAVVWSMLHAFGFSAAPAVVVLAYFVGQVANTIPIPGSVSGGIAGVLIAFGVPAQLALPAVLAYRAVAVWLPSPIGILAVARLRTTLARWAREDAGAGTPARSEDCSEPLSGRGPEPDRPTASSARRPFSPDARAGTLRASPRSPPRRMKLRRAGARARPRAPARARAWCTRSSATACGRRSAASRSGS